MDFPETVAALPYSLWALPDCSWWLGWLVWLVRLWETQVFMSLSLKMSRNTIRVFVVTPPLSAGSQVPRPRSYGLRHPPRAKLRRILTCGMRLSMATWRGGGEGHSMANRLIVSKAHIPVRDSKCLLDCLFVRTLLGTNVNLLGGQHLPFWLCIR